MSSILPLTKRWLVHAASFGRMYHAGQQNLGDGGFSPISNPQYGWAWIAF
jgi:hypothetical protein